MSKTYRRKDNRFRNTPKLEFSKVVDYQHAADNDLDTDHPACWKSHLKWLKGDDSRFHTDSFKFDLMYYADCWIRQTHGQIRSRYRNRLKSYQGLEDFEDCCTLDVEVAELNSAYDWW